MKKEIYQIEDNLKKLLQKKLSIGGLCESDKKTLESCLDQLVVKNDSLKIQLTSLVFNLNGKDLNTNNISFTGNNNLESHIKNNKVVNSVTENDGNQSNDVSEISKSYDEDNVNNNGKQLKHKRGRNGKVITDCPHADRKHYAKVRIV
jgi:hypothetical protein